MAIDGTLLLEIVTPTGVALSERVDEVIVPSVQGEFGVLAGHLPMLAALDTGLLHYRQGHKLTDVAVGIGFAEVFHDKTLVLTDRFVRKPEVDVLAVRERLKKVDKELESWTGEGDDHHHLELIEEEQWLAAQLELHGDPPVPKVLSQARSVDYQDILPEADERPEDEAGE
jgi:F-type H+-transporting ATPase subunit epsilon